MADTEPARFPASQPSFVRLVDGRDGDSPRAAHHNKHYRETEAIARLLGAGTTVTARGGILARLKAGRSVIGFSAQAALEVHSDEPQVLVAAKDWDAPSIVAFMYVIKTGNDESDCGLTVLGNGKTKHLYGAATGENALTMTYAETGDLTVARTQGILTYSLAVSILALI